MERGIITIAECGTIIPPDVPNESVWMSEMELVELFGGIAPTLRVAIRAVYKSGVLKGYDVQKYVQLENGCHTHVFSFPMVVTLTFRINTFGAEKMRNSLLDRICLRKEKTSIFFSLNVNGMATSKYQA